MLPASLSEVDTQAETSASGLRSEPSAKALTSKRSQARLADKSPYSTNSKQSNAREGNNDFISQQNQDLINQQTGLRTQVRE